MAMWARLTYFFVALAFLLSILVQVFLAGMGLFESAGYWETHGGFGYSIVHPIALVLLVFAFIGRLPRPTLIVVVVTVLLAIFMPYLATLPSQYSFFAALHPVSAVILFGFSVFLAVQAREFVPPPWGRVETAE